MIEKPSSPPEDVWRNQADPDEAYDRMRQDQVDDEFARALAIRRDQAHAGLPMLQTKIGQFTGKVLYSYDGVYWWSTEETAHRIFQQTRRAQQ